MVVLAMTILLMSSLFFMLHYSKKAIKEEAINNAIQTIDGITNCIDNILLSTEQTTGNFYYMMYDHLNDSNQVKAFSRKVVESNPYITGCAIAFEPNYYKGCDHFMAYYNRSKDDNSKIERLEQYGNSIYTQQYWYTQALNSSDPKWVNPTVDVEGVTEPIISFCLPLKDANQKVVGVMGVDVSLNMLSDIVLEAKPSPNSYCTILDKAGTYLIHPDSDKLFNQTIFSQAEYESETGLRDAVKAMLAGETGYDAFCMKDSERFIFYKPFMRTAVKGRSMEELNWYIGIIFSREDIYGDYEKLLRYIFIFALIGLLVMFILCRFFIHRQLLPLRLLTASAQRIAEGKFDEHIPESRHHDEIGRLQDNFQKMQKSLATHIGELEQLKSTLQEHGEELKKAYNEAQKADRMKTAFLHNMTNQMISPAELINKDVTALCDSNTSTENTSKIAEDIQKNGNKITKLLNDLISASEDEMRKEGAHD